MIVLLTTVLLMTVPFAKFAVYDRAAHDRVVRDRASTRPVAHTMSNRHLNLAPTILQWWSVPVTTAGNTQRARVLLILWFTANHPTHTSRIPLEVLKYVR